MQFVYVLKLIPRLMDEGAWAEKDHEIVEAHFNYLKTLKQSGNLILAGRTTQEGNDNFGLVILKGDEKDAIDMMNNDPAILNGIMTSDFYPYRVALISEENV